MYKIPDVNCDYIDVTKGMDTAGNLIAYCKLPERNPMLQELEERLSSMLEPDYTESEHDDIVFGRYVS